MPTEHPPSELHAALRDDDQVLELVRDIADRLRELSAVDSAILGELRYLTAPRARPGDTRRDQGRDR